MGRNCTICDDSRIDEIDRQCRIEKNIEKIATNFSISSQALRRHIGKNHHIRDATTIPSTAEISKSEDLLKEICNNYEEAKRLKGLAEAQNDLKTALLAVDKSLKCLELLAKIQGQIHEQNINIYQQNILINNPEWIDIRTKLLNALRPFPDAKAAVILAIQ